MTQLLRTPDLSQIGKSSVFSTSPLAQNSNGTVFGGGPSFLMAKSSQSNLSIKDKSFLENAKAGGRDDRRFNQRGDAFIRQDSISI
jgi:hypothetical protein